MRRTDMHVVLGALLLSGQQGFRQAGVHHYARELLRALARAPHDGIRFTALLPASAADQLTPDERAALHVRTVPARLESPLHRTRFEQIALPRLLRELRADVYHGLAFVAPIAAPCPTIVSVMDLSFLTHPHTHRPIPRLYLRTMTQLSCRRARRIIAISEWTKRDIVRCYGIDPARVDAIPLAVDHERFRPLSPDARRAFRTAHGIGDRAVFYLGSIEPRKNLTRLIDAFARLPQPAQLFIGGSLAWKYDEILARVQRLGLHERVHMLGRIEPQDLPAWYSACTVFAYPSLYEGFGFPPLEAMACGAAVVSSDASSLPEVVGDAGLTVAPTDVDALARALARLLDDDDLRRSLQQRAVARAAAFTWERVATQTIAAYEQMRR
jgi:glycosyltransferase involved in cell wall biosynthesis